jgi:hypothetical protein
VVTHVGPLTEVEVALALDRGLSVAYAMKEAGHVIGAYLSLRGQRRLIGRIPMQRPDTQQQVTHV